MTGFRVWSRLFLAMLLAHCAGDMADLNRVQPGYVRKADLLDASWFYRRTVVDASEANAWASIGSGDLFTLERVRFVVQEERLLAYRDYAYVPGSRAEDAGTDAPVAVYPIREHFDIQREYVAQTGEETNIISSNTEDRPWHERDFMRVDWSTNLQPSLDQVIPVQVLMDGNNSAESNFYVHENAAADPYRARIEPDTGYIDFVVNHFVMPDMATCLRTFGLTECTHGEIKVRHAFLRVDGDREAQYEDLWYPDSVPVLDADGREILDADTGEVLREEIFGRFGFYRLERPVYDPQRGLQESTKLDRILRFDLWERSFDDVGEAIPVADRQVRPIVYHLNWDFPDELKSLVLSESTPPGLPGLSHGLSVGDAWNGVLRRVVAALQERPLEEIPDVLVVRENDCRLDVLQAYWDSQPSIQAAVNARLEGEVDLSRLDHYCAATEYASREMPAAERFTWQQNGDPRFNMMVYLPQITPARWAGYGPMLANPLSGRVVTATAYVLGWSVDASATRALEYVDYLNGVLDVDDVLLGHRLALAPPAQSFASSQRVTPSAAHLRSLRRRMRRLKAMGDALPELPNRNYYAERLAQIAGSDVERRWLLRDEDLVAASDGRWRPGMEADAALYDDAGLAARTRRLAQALDDTEQFLGKHTFCPAMVLDHTLEGLAERLRPLPRDARRTFLKRAIFQAVMLHEVGHNLGLRHNFEASFDALNYADAFWDIELTAPDEAARRAARQSEFKYSSIMDYHGRINADFQGLGKYDEAALAFGYGQLMQQFAADDIVGGEALRTWRFEHDYRGLPDHLGSLSRMSERGYARFDWTEPVNQSALEALKTHEVPYLFCSDEYARRTPTCRRFDLGASHQELVQAARTRYKNYFLFDNFLRHRLHLPVMPGRRAYEMFRDIVTTYQYMYLYLATEAERMSGGDFLATELGEDMVGAVAMGLNTMAEVLAVPEPGRYWSCEDSEARTYLVPERFIVAGRGPEGEVCAQTEGDEVDIPVGDGLPLFLGLTDDYTEWTISYFGTYWDKTLALQELADPTAVYFRVNGREDNRAYSVSPFRLYSREILDLYSRMITHDLPLLGGVWAGDAFVPPALIDPQNPLGNTPVPMPAGMPVLPALARNLQRSAILFGTALLTSPLDAVMDFAKHTRVAVEGGADDFSAYADDDLAVARCTLPTSGLTYVAKDTRADYPISLELVARCHAATARLRSAEEAMDGLVDEGEIAAAEVELAEARAEVATFEQLLQFTRRVHAIFEHGIR